MKQHPYCYIGTDILINKLDIRDEKILEMHERLESAMRAETLSRNIEISPSGYKEIHQYLLSNVYDWAGKYRDVNTGRGAPFCKSDFIDTEMNKRFEIIKAEDNLRGLDTDQFVKRTAEHLNELNAIHPFLDGNGRTQRAFLEILGKHAGHEIDLARINPEKWNSASIEGFYKQEHGPMRDVIAQAIVRPRAHERHEQSALRAGLTRLTADQVAQSVNDPALRAVYNREQSEAKTAKESSPHDRGTVPGLSRGAPMREAKDSAAVRAAKRDALTVDPRDREQENQRDQGRPPTDGGRGRKR